MTHHVITESDAVAWFHFDCTTDKPALTRGQPDAGTTLTGVCEILVKKRVVPVSVIYSDYLTNSRGFMSTFGLQRRLPWAEEDGEDVLTLQRRLVHVSTLSLEDSNITTDLGEYFKRHGEPGLIASPLIAIALARSVTSTVVSYRSDQRIYGDDLTPLRRALRRDVEQLDSVVAPELVEKSLNHVLSARHTFSHGDIHVAVWKKR